MLSLSLRDLQSGDGAAIPIAGRGSAIVLLVVTLTVITACLSMSFSLLQLLYPLPFEQFIANGLGVGRRTINLPQWRDITLTRWCKIL